MTKSILISETKQFHYKGDDKRISPSENKTLALIYVLGRNASQNGGSIFDCPHQAGSDKAESWMDGFMFDQKARGKK